MKEHDASLVVFGTDSVVTVFGLFRSADNWKMR